VSDLSAAAAAMGIPEPIAERSARARADATGQSYEEVLAAWAGGQPVSGTDTPPTVPAEAETEEAIAPVEGAPAPSAPEPAAAAPAPAPAATVVGPVTTGAPPILDAPADRPLVWTAGGIAVVALALLLGFVFPSLPAETSEVRSSNFPLSAAGEEGRAEYLQAGCASCHTQAVRSVVADVGIGPVALADTNQVIGFRRIGPDLSNAGGRMSADQLESAITGASHPALPLSDSALAAVATYLSETASPIPGGES
jgi:hypothetical protein